MDTLRERARPPTLRRAFSRVALSPATRWRSSEPALLAARYLKARLHGDAPNSQSLYDVVSDPELAEGMTRVATALLAHLAADQSRAVDDVLAELVDAAEWDHHRSADSGRDA